MERNLKVTEPARLRPHFVGNSAAQEASNRTEAGLVVSTARELLRSEWVERTRNGFKLESQDTQRASFGGQQPPGVRLCPIPVRRPQCPSSAGASHHRTGA